MSFKKVILISPLPPPYMGPTVAAEIILNSELKNKFMLIHLDSSDHRSLNTLNKIDITNIFLALRHYIELFLLILKNCPDAVYIPISQTTTGYLRDSGFILISKLFRKKVICHLRGGNFRNWFRSSSIFTQLYVRFVHSLVDCQIVLGEKLRCLFYKIMAENKIFVIPNGLNLNPKINILKIKNNSDLIKVLFFSNFKRTKGILDVLHAIPDVYRHSKDVEFIFAGSWREKETKKEIENFIFNNQKFPILIKGPVYGREKCSLFHSSDIFVFPPISQEGHPWVIVEAMAAGLPIIATDQGAITESVKDGINGFIVEKRNPKQIAERIVALIENPSLRKKMGEASRQLYEENFTEEKMVQKLSQVFHAVLSQ